MINFFLPVDPALLLLFFWDIYVIAFIRYLTFYIRFSYICPRNIFPLCCGRLANREQDGWCLQCTIVHVLRKTENHCSICCLAFLCDFSFPFLILKLLICCGVHWNISVLLKMQVNQVYAKYSRHLETLIRSRSMWHLKRLLR